MVGQFFWEWKTSPAEFTHFKIQLLSTEIESESSSASLREMSAQNIKFKKKSTSNLFGQRCTATIAKFTQPERNDNHGTRKPHIPKEDH